MLRVVVLISGSGSNLQALLDDEHGYRVGAVVADRAAAGGLARATQRDVPALGVPLATPKDHAQRAAWEAEVTQVIHTFQPDLIVMAGWMRIMSPIFVAQFPNLINQHPALLPPDGSDSITLPDGQRIPALRGAHAVRDALRHGLAVTGCTVHRVTAEVDVGPVLAQAIVPIHPTDDEATLHERIKHAERRLIVQVVRELAAANPSL